MDTVTETNPRAVMGANNPPPFDPEVFADLAKTVDEFMASSTAIRKKAVPIANEEHAALLTDHIGGLRGLTKKVDDARKAAKKPHDDAGKAVQEAFNPLLDRIKLALDFMLAEQTAWLRKKAAAEAARKAEEDRIAKEKQAEADRLAAEAAATGDFDAEARAAEAQKQADELAKQAAKPATVNQASASGAGRTIGMVKVRSAKITNINLLFLHYRDRPEVAEVLLRLANADIRAKDVDDSLIQGIEIIETETAR